MVSVLYGQAPTMPGGGLKPGESVTLDPSKPINFQLPGYLCVVNTHGERCPVENSQFGYRTFHAFLEGFVAKL